MSGDIVLATTTFYTKGSERAPLALESAREALAHNLPLVVVDGSPGAFGREFRTQLRDLGAQVYDEEEKGMSPTRRQALRLAGVEAGECGVVVWFEPEKWMLISQIKRLAIPILVGEADIVIPWRDSLATYPTSQRYEERLGNLIFNRLTPEDQLPLDPWVGPRLIRVGKPLDLFLTYDGKEEGYGDLWDSIFVPVFRAIAQKMYVIPMVITYSHPNAQLDVEEGDVLMDLKRVQQFANLISALVKEAARLGWVNEKLTPRINFSLP